MGPVNAMSIGPYRPNEVRDSRHTALENGDEYKGEVVQGEDRDSAKDDIALPTLANAMKVKGNRQFSENLVHDEQDAVTDGELYRSVQWFN